MKKIFLLIITIFFTSCAIKQNHPIQVNNFLIETSDFKSDKFKNSNKILLISSPTGVSHLDTKSIIYSEDKNAYLSYLYSYWGEYPNVQYVNLFTKKIEESGLFKAVVSTSSKTQTNFTLESRFDTFEHRIRNNYSYVSIKANLILIDSVSRKIISNKYFSYEIPTNSVNAKGAVEAFSIGFDNFSNDCIYWLNEAISNEI